MAVLGEYLFLKGVPVFVIRNWLEQMGFKVHYVFSPFLFVITPDKPNDKKEIHDDG